MTFVVGQLVSLTYPPGTSSPEDDGRTVYGVIHTVDARRGWVEVQWEDEKRGWLTLAEAAERLVCEE